MTEPLDLRDFLEKIEVNPEFLKVEFDQSCDLDGFIGFLLQRVPEQREELIWLEQVYRQYHPANQRPSKQPKIPKIIHQIWLGGELPAQFADYRKKWQQLHPDWTFYLWDEQSLDELEFADKDLYIQAHKIGWKVDIIRAEILHRYGGLYIDTDYQCFEKFDFFRHCYDLYGTLRVYPILHLWWPGIYPSPLTICNSLIGARPGHPIFREYLRLVRNNWQHPEMTNLSEKEQRTCRLLQLDQNKLQTEKSTILTTYRTFHQAFCNIAGQQASQDIIFPPTFFNPIDTWWRVRYWLPRFWLYWSWYRCQTLFRSPYAFRKAREHSFSHHDSQATWLVG